MDMLGRSLKGKKIQECEVSAEGYKCGIYEEVEEVVWGTRTPEKRQHKVCLKCNPGQGVMNNQFVLENSGIINKRIQSIVQGKYWHDWRGTRKT